MGSSTLITEKIRCREGCGNNKVSWTRSRNSGFSNKTRQTAKKSDCEVCLSINLETACRLTKSEEKEQRIRFLSATLKILTNFFGALFPQALEKKVLFTLVLISKASHIFDTKMTDTLFLIYSCVKEH